MNRAKKEMIIFCILFLLSMSYSYADETGCCTNPSAGLLTCSTDRLALRDKECCPKPEASFPSYYKSQQNPDNPLNANECATNFFFPGKACSDQTITACALGCCCSELGGSIAAEAQCKGTGLIFHKGQTNCNVLCPIPQCNDGQDNDENGCADFEGGDLGCTSPSDSQESGGSCSVEGAGCTNPAYIPKLSNLEIKPIKGQKKFLLNWNDECSETVVSYDILRCKESGCTNFAIVGTTNTNSFEDSSGDLLLDTTYTYQVKSRYNLQIATPTIAKTATLGNIECFDQLSSNNFCIHEPYYTKYKNYLTATFPEIFLRSFTEGVKSKFGERFNKAFSCDTSNKLIPEGTACSSTQVCLVDNNKPACLSKINCNYLDANPFGLFYTQQACENGKYCFYDRSHTTIDSCFSCDPSMACYDYKTEESCARNNCQIGNCRWNSIANNLGIGACVSTTEYNCQWCEKKGTSTLENTRSFNEVFDFCTRDKSNVLSEGTFKCYFKNGKSKNCDDVVCSDYEQNQCSNSQIIHDENNRIINPSADECGIKACQNINNACVKNADGNNVADCSSSSCESDYFAPNTTLLSILRKGIIDKLVIQIYDRTSINSSVILKSSNDYITFLCAEPCGQNGHPYSTSTANRVVVISNLNAFDGTSGTKLLSLAEGTNIIRYYAQDPAKNIGEVKKITIEVHDNVNGPKVLSINLTGGTKVLDRIYTNNQKPVIEVQFLEPAIVTHSRLVNKATGLIVQLQGNTEPSTKVSFAVAENLPNGEYVFELNSKNKNNIFMDQAVNQIIVIDNSKPTITVSIPDGAVINTSVVAITVTFNKEASIKSLKINSEELKEKFSTTDNKVFTAAFNISDGNKALEITGEDFAKNTATKIVNFVVDANQGTITLSNPKFGTAPRYTFDLAVETDNNAVCKYSLDNNFEFDFMEQFAVTSGTLHKITDFNKISPGDLATHKLYVRCKDKRGISFKAFDLNVDASPPQLKGAFAFPAIVAELPSSTALSIESDEPVVCKYSTTSNQYDNMEGKFEGFDSSNFKTINRQQINVESEGSFSYFVSCMNKAELKSETKEIQFKVDLSLPISISSHTPEFFNSTNIVLAVETNKKSQCKFSEADKTAQSGEIFGLPGYGHTRQLTLAAGEHTFYITCRDQLKQNNQVVQRFSEPIEVKFVIDLTPPIILSVNDSSTLPNPEFGWSADNLRVKWSSIDYESRVKLHTYSLLEYSTSNTILNWTTSFVNNEWLIVTKANGSSLGLTNSNKYFFRVRSQNIVGLSSNITESDGITIDTSLKPLNCTNGIKDEKESDVDCGSGCDLCDLNKKCNVNIDCKTNFCHNGTCAAPKCDDNIKNQDESGTDCGGNCKKCANNQACNVNNDCESIYCSFGFCKPQESCSDGKLSPAEAAIDCGGACPKKCIQGEACQLNDDCGEGLQCISSVCKACAENDSNCNGIPDDQESGFKDSDNDGMSDDWEIQNGLNPNDPSDADMDSDNDGLSNSEEFNLYKIYGKSTNPNLADSDDDKFTDKEEVDNGTSPVNPDDFPKSNLGKILLFALGIAILLSGIVYLSHKAMAKRKETKPEMRKQPGIMGVFYRQLAKQIPQKSKEDEKLREALKRKEEEKARAREKLFEGFGKEKPEERKAEKQEEEGAKEEKITRKETKPEKKQLPKKKSRFKSKEDVFIRLNKIAKEAKAKRKKNAKK
ncbi:hypothetical protein J4234_00425 [Candidatus Woesearchaeota archaeon]|nr:hypothetical protein [Candidatus Woesearchaeota archaeon]